MKRLMTTLAALGILCGAPVLAEDNPVEGCENALEAWEDKDPALALEEARWCVEGLEQVKQAALAGQFRDEVMGMEGGAVNEQRAMGIMVVERSYAGDGKRIDVSLTRASDASNPMGSLGALSSSMGLMGAGRRVRIEGHSGIFITDRGDLQLMVTPREGDGILKFVSGDLAENELQGFAEAFLAGFEF